MGRLRLKVMLITLGGSLLLLPETTCALTLTKNQDLQFGSFLCGGGGTVTIDTSGGRHPSGGVRVLGTAFSAARFSLTGSPGESYTLTIPASLTMASGSDQMVVSAVTCSVPVSGTVPPGGSLAITLGGTLTVKGTQRSATYLGTFELSATGN